jgi:hypothetical protein
MKLLIQRLLVSTAIAIVALGSAGNAMAANPHYKARASAAQAPYRYQAPLDVAAIPPYPNYSSNAAPAPHSGAGYDFATRPPYPQWTGGFPVAGRGIDVGQVIAALFGGALPLHYGKVAVSGSDSSDWSPTYDTSPAVDVGPTPEQTSADAAAAAMQDEDANLAALDASIAAAQEQNDEANAATQQYLTNNGM